ncbi:MAG: S28 family serine protease [Bacteroidota bacterium]
MSEYLKTLILGLILLITSSAYAQDTITPLYKYLSSIPDLEFEEMPASDPFNEKYLLYVPQFVDHKNPDMGQFTQRVYVMHRDKEAPVVFVTEGYGAAYAGMAWYKNELDYYLGSNEIVVEHRYFGPSTPDPLDWQYLTVENAATDHHNVIELLKPFFKGKWVSTGISKGGQTAMYHRTYYPDDVDATVGYVCPLNFSIEEQRCYEFLDQVGTDECRRRVHDFQKMLLCNKHKYYPAFKSEIDSAGLHFRLGDTAGYELTVLEYSFAFWQWGSIPCDSIPGADASPEEAIIHLGEVAGLDWVSVNGIGRLQAFFYQALTEIGFYGYNHGEFDGCVEALDYQTFDFSCPQGYDCIYDPQPMEKVDNFVRHKGKNMIFIYGECDPWSAPAVQVTGKTNSFKIVKPQGSHLTRIRNLPDDQRQKVLKALGEWLKCEINR